MAERKDQWTQVEDQILAETIINHIASGARSTVACERKYGLSII